MSSLFNNYQLEDVLNIKALGCKSVDVKRVEIDSRQADREALFIPLVGEVTDGNLYIESALKNGCKSSLVSRDFYNKHEVKIHGLLAEYGCSIFIVEDGLKALHLLAKEYINRFSNLLVIGITGSSGKTSTKEVLGAILKEFDKTLITNGNYNSETGLPLTVFRIKDKHRYAVIEMGMSKPGEIKALVDIVNPHISIITNIGRAHIGFFESINGIAEEKKDAFANFSGNNVGIIPDWDDFSEFLQKDVDGKVIAVKNLPEYVSDVKDLGFDGWEFLYEGKKVFYPYIGRYNLLNSFLAIAAARELKVPTDIIIKGLSSVKSLFGRGEVLDGRNRIIRDCYNANPDSTLSSLNLLLNTDWSGEKVAILGDMLELGDASVDEHLKVLTYVKDLNLSKIILYGNEYNKAFDSLKEKKGFLFCKDKPSLIDVVKNLCDNSLVLLKASRGVKLEEITEYILK